MPLEGANTHRKRIFRGFKASRWTDIALNTTTRDIIPGELTSKPTPSNDDYEVQQEHLGTKHRRKWIIKVQRRSAGRRPDRLKIQESPQSGHFSSLPIQSKGHVPRAFEFFKNVYVPTNSSVAGFKTYCQVILQDPMLFEQMMAYSLVMQHMDKKPKRRMTAESLYHSNKSVIQLRQRLQVPDIEDRTSDAVVMTILILIAFYVTCGDFEPWSLHMKALQRVTAMRGGADKLGWNGFIQTKVKQVEAAWSTFEARHTVVEQAETELFYPDHPFSPHLCSQIAKFPSGLRELALRRRISVQFIGVLEEVLHRMEDIENQPSAVAVTSVMEDVITIPELTAIERVVAVSLISRCIASAKAREGVPPSVEISRQAHARSLPLGRGLYPEGSPEEDAFDWAALVIRATTERNCTAWNWACQRINSGDADLVLVTRRWELQGKFLEIPT